MIAVSFFLCRRVWYTEKNILVNFSLLVYYGEDFALLGEFLCPRRQRKQNAAGDGGRESAKNFWRGKFFLRFCAASPRTPITGEQAALRCSYLAKYESAHTAFCFAKWRRFYGG